MSRKVVTAALEQHPFINKVIMSFPSQSPLGSDPRGKPRTAVLKLPQVSGIEKACPEQSTFRAGTYMCSSGFPDK